MMGFVKHSKPTSNWGGPPCPIFAQESLAALQQAGRCRSKQHGVWALLVKQFWLGLSRLLPGGMLSPGDNCWALLFFVWGSSSCVFPWWKKTVFFFFIFVGPSMQSCAALIWESLLFGGKGWTFFCRQSDQGVPGSSWNFFFFHFE